jgi:hypothetical protein
MCDPVHTDKNSSNGSQIADAKLTVGYTDNTAANSALGRHADIIDSFLSVGVPADALAMQDLAEIVVHPAGKHCRQGATYRCQRLLNSADHLPEII